MEVEPKTRKLTCIVTGKVLLAAIEYYQKKIQKAGSEEMLHRTYMCREAKDLLYRGHTIEEIRKLLGSKLTTIIPDEVINLIINQKIKNRVLSKPQIPVHYETDKDVVKFLNSLKRN